MDQRNSSKMRLAGALIQGIFLGILLAIAIYRLIATRVDTRLFEYQGF